MSLAHKPDPGPERTAGAQAYNRQGPLADGWGRAVLVTALGLALGIALLAAIWLLARPLALLSLGTAIAAALAPLVAWLERRLPRPFAVILIYLVIVLVFVGIGWIVVPPMVSQAAEIGARAPELVGEAQGWLNNLTRRFNVDLVDTLLPELGRLSTTLVALPAAILSSLFEIVVVLFISIYLLIEAPAIQRFVLSLFAEGQSERVDDLLQKMAQAMGGYIRGTIITAGLVGLFMYIGLLVIGVDFPLVLGLLAAVFELIPYLGPILAAVPILTIALLESTGQALITLIFIVVLQQVESYLLVPNIMRTQTKISPLLVILAIIVGSRLGGLLGVLVAIPLAAALRVFVHDVIAPAIRRRTGTFRVEYDEVQS